MGTRTNIAIVNFFVRYPLIGVVAFIAFGVWMGSNSIKEGTEKARFVGGPRAVGTVVELRGNWHEMTASWRDQSGNAHSGTVELFRNEYDSLKAGNRVDLLLARDDHSKALVAAHVEHDRPITVLGITATPMIYFAIVAILAGLLFPVMVPRLQKELSGAV